MFVLFLCIFRVFTPFAFVESIVSLPAQVRKNLVSSGASISAQLQEDVYQYMQAHNRKIVVGQSWVRTMRAGFADVNTTFTLVWAERET